MSHSEIFTRIYESQVWGEGSGRGSTLEFNQEFISFLQNFIRQHNIHSVVDLGCGDFQCGQAIYKDLGIKYTGCDVYPRLI